MAATAPGKKDSGARLPIPLMVALPAAALLVTCLYELLGRGASLAEATSIRVTGTLLLCCCIFTSLCRLARLALGLGGQVSAVARALVSEATSTRIAPAFLFVLFSALAALALFDSPETPVRYLLQGFLSYSLVITSVLAGILTLLLSCRTLSIELEDKLIETIAVKPIGRGSYLAGKWMGLVILNGILLGVAVSAIYIFSVHHIARLPPRDERDSVIVREEILTARELVPARIEPPLEAQLERRLARLQEKDPESIERLARRGHRHSHGAEGHPGLAEKDRLARARQSLREDLARRSLSISPGKSRNFSFAGLGALRDSGSPARVRYRLASQPGRTPVTARLTVTAGPASRELTFTPSSTGYFELNPADIDESGVLQLSISNPPDSTGAIIFSTRNGLEALKTRGGFLGNLLRTMLTTWIKLCFLSILGLLCSSFLGFPVAVLLCGLVLLVASTSPFLLEAAELGRSADSPGGFFETFAATTTQTLATALSRYSEFDPALLLIDGRTFSWGELWRCLLWIGVLWTGLSGIFATLIYKRRELARIQV